ncbi:uncharacterized protein LOC143275644 [Babylonia areolata]|uniref:uncharacterized protein LOC143275644 n=1 Tax=Babylonia areolata TaxID=304850 RepID=UPI003FD32D9A
MSKSGEYVPSPRPNPRLRPEGAAYAERNRGTMERWFDYSDTMPKAQDTAAAAAAAVDDGGSEGVEISTGVAEGAGTPVQTPEAEMSGSMVGGGEGEETPAPVEVEGIDSGEGEGAVPELTDRCGHISLKTSAPGPAQEAKEYAERNRGQMDHILNNYRATPPSPPASSKEPPSTHTQGTETADPDKSPRKSARQHTLHQESMGRSWDENRPAPRIRADGESIAMKQTTDSMFDIMRSDKNSPQSSPVKTVRSGRQNQESAVEQCQSGGPPRTRPGEGTKNYERAHDQSEMAAILRGEGDHSRAAAPRNIRHLQRSELW